MKKIIPFALFVLLFTACTSNTADLPKDRSDQEPPVAQIPANWISVELPAIELSYSLPPSLAQNKEVEEVVEKGEKGTQYCVSLITKSAGLIPEAYAGGGCGFPADAKVMVGTTSTDYSAGRGGTFLDLQGFSQTDNKFFVKRNLNRTDEIPSYSADIISNSHGIEALLVRGENRPGAETGINQSLVPEGWFGGLLNIGNPTYPGLTIMVDGSIIKKSDFELVLSSFKKTK